MAKVLIVGKIKKGVRKTGRMADYFIIRCSNCKYVWIAQKPVPFLPTQCPKCHSQFANVRR